MGSDDRTEFFACLALKHTPGIGPRRWKTLLAHYPSAKAALDDHDSWVELGLCTKRQAREAAEQSWRPGAEAEYRLVLEKSMDKVLYTDKAFPEELRNIPDPPIILYYQGNVSLLDTPGVAVVGARQCTPKSLDIVEALSADLSRFGLTVISGLALGIDRQAHLGALKGIGKSIGVLGTGLDVIYPRQNEDLWGRLTDEGLIVSEFCPETQPAGRNFPHRNRIISGLSLGVVVGEAKARSGGLITARLALDQGREVFAIPGRGGDPHFEGCNRLIKEGAHLADEASDILFVLREQLRVRLTPEKFHSIRRATDRSKPKKKKPDRAGGNGDSPDAASEPSERVENQPPHLDALPERERDVMERLGRERIHIDNLTRSLSWDSGTVSQVLLMLELRGLVKHWPGKYYTIA